MKTRYIAACVLAATMGVGPLAYGAPIGSNGPVVTQFRSTNESASGFNGCAANVCVSFFAQAFDDMNGVAQGFVQAVFQDLNNGQFVFISCSGPAFANSVSVNQSNGNASVSATLDPSAPGCSSFNVFFGTVTLNLTGQADGNFHLGQDGTFIQEFGGQSVKGKFTSDQFGETFNGAVGSVSGTFSGSVSAAKNSSQQRVR